MISSLVLLILAATPAHADLSSEEAKAVKTLIDSQSKEDSNRHGRAKEFVGGRRVARGDLDGDGNDELVVLFTLEQGNVWTQFLGVLGPGSKPVARKRVGRKGDRSVELTAVTKGRIELATRRYGRADALCCPSIEGHSWFVLRGTALEEDQADIIVVKH